MPQIPDASNPPTGAPGPIGGPPPAPAATPAPSSDAAGPVQLERAWHGLMYTMGGTKGPQVRRMQTINSAALHLRQMMKAR